MDSSNITMLLAFFLMADTSPVRRQLRLMLISVLGKNTFSFVGVHTPSKLYLEILKQVLILMGTYCDLKEGLLALTLAYLSC